MKEGIKVLESKATYTEQLKGKSPREKDMGNA